MLKLTRLIFTSNFHRNIQRTPNQNRTIQIRNISVGCSLNVKRYLDTENIYAHNILKKNSLCNVYRERPASLLTNSTLPVTFEPFQRNYWASLDTKATLLYFRQICEYCRQNNVCISMDIFNDFVDNFTEKCIQFTDDQVVEALKILIELPETQDINTPNFLELWKCLDDVCSDRIKEWSFEHTMFVCDLWYQLRLGRICNFSWHASKKIGRRIRKMEPHEMIQSIFYCNLLRSPIIDMFDFEASMLRCLNKLSIDEISVMCMGFFKTQTKLKTPELVKGIYERLILETETIKDITLVSVLKTLRYSSKPDNSIHMNKLLDLLVKEIPRLSLLSCLHIALTGTDIGLNHRKSLELIIERFLKELKSARLKDLERISFAIGLCDFTTKDGNENELCRRILAEYKLRVNEIANFPRCLTNSIHFLMYKGFHDEELINTVLGDKFLRMTFGNTMLLGREMFSIDSYARINLKDSYNGNLLSDKRIRLMGKHLSQYIPVKNGKYKLSKTDRLLIEIKDALDGLYKYCKIAHVLPHYERPDNIIAYDTIKKEVVDISHHFPMLYSGKILTKDLLLENEPNKDCLKLFNFIIGGWNNFERNEGRPTGPLKLKIEQSRLIGFQPVLISYHEWCRLTTEERPIYIKNVLLKDLL